MPTTKRRRRHARNNEQQRQYFLYGDVFGATDNEPLFTSLEEEKRGWFLVRDELLRECRAQFGPGRRPYAYFRFELGCAPARWFEEIEVLLRHGLIDATEAVGIEATHQMLSPGQSEAFCSGFGDHGRIAQMQLGHYVLKSLADEFTIAGDFHEWRNRPGLAQRYRVRAAECIRSL